MLEEEEEERRRFGWCSKSVRLYMMMAYVFASTGDGLQCCSSEKDLTGFPHSPAVRSSSSSSISSWCLPMYVSFMMLDSIDYSNSASVLYNAVQIFWIRQTSFADLSFPIYTLHAELVVGCPLGKKIALRRVAVKCK